MKNWMTEAKFKENNLSLGISSENPPNLKGLCYNIFIQYFTSPAIFQSHSLVRAYVLEFRSIP